MATQVTGPAIAPVINITTGYDLYSSAFSQTTNIVSDYILDALNLEFSSNATKRVTIRDAKNLLVWDSGLTTSTQIRANFNESFELGNNVTMTVIQTAAPCLMTGTLTVRPGTPLPVEYAIKQRLEDILIQLTDQSASPHTAIQFLSLIYSTLANGTVVGGGGGGGTTVTPPARPTFGSILNVSPGQTITMVSVLAEDNFKLRGFTATGEGDGYFKLLIAGTEVLSGRIHVMERNINPSFLGSLPVADGVTITLQVRNDSSSLCSYEGVILGE